MKSSSTQTDVIETHRNKFFQHRGAGMIAEGESKCIVFCTKMTANTFHIKDGFAVVAKDCFSDGVCVISNAMKVVFVFNQVKKKNES